MKRKLLSLLTITLAAALGMGAASYYQQNAGAGLAGPWSNQLALYTHQRQVLAFGPTITIDADTGNVFDLTLTGNVTSSTILNGEAGQVITFIIRQDATGNWTLTWPSNVYGGIATGVYPANAVSVQSFVYDGSNWYALDSSTAAGS